MRAASDSDPNRQTHGLVLSVDVVSAAETARLDEASTPIVDDSLRRARGEPTRPASGPLILRLQDRRVSFVSA